ncbi:MAG: outer membrane protein assembly factor BamA [Pseudomonadales bacterium]|nr:outer membrane protein assembly factor BamA [Pseudomonadales bacterium]
MIRVVFILFCFSAFYAQADSFVVKDIRIEGLQRVSIGAVFNILTLEAGDSVEESQLAEVARTLFGTGNFKDVSMYRENDTLIIRVSERPSISSIELDGNKSIETEMLLEGLAQAGLSEGSVFQRATLDRIKLELERQYTAQGRYAARVIPEVTPLPRNRVKIDIEIKEGDVATISGIDIVGNEVFDDEDLLDEFQLKVSHLTSFFSGDDKYSRERLSGDLETLRSYYMDRGYVKFNIESTQVSVTPDKAEVYVAINVSEGEIFKVNEVKLSGDLKVDEEELKNLLLVRDGQTFSRQLVTLTNELITKRLGNEGYTFANVNGVPEINEEDKTVDVTFYVDPGARVYVRRVNFYGNVKTRDEVLRREMRQMEGSWANGQLIENSKVRLERLGFFKGVTVETPKVPGSSDQIDVNYSVEEQPSGSISASLGYQQGSGFVFGASISQKNFLGTGNQVSFSINRSDIRNSYNFSYLDPYFTVDGVSRGYSLFFQETDIDEDSAISSWSMDRFGGNVNFGYPISEISRLSFAVGYENVKIFAGQRSPLDVWEWVGYDLYDAILDNRVTQTEDYNLFTASGRWSASTLNRGVFATRGYSQSLALEASFPDSEIEYYKINYRGERYFPLTDIWTLKMRANVGYGDGYGDDDKLPFFEHYYSGGFGSVRGYEDRSLGPRERQSPTGQFGDVDAIGGNLLVEGALEFIFPVPFVKDKRSIRTLLFIDGGNVFDTQRDDDLNIDFDTDEFRYSYGIGLSWITGIGPLTFSLSRPFNDQDDDETKRFQFSLGRPL